MIILPMLLLTRILANSTLRFHITGPGTRLNLRSKIKSINQSQGKRDESRSFRLKAEGKREREKEGDGNSI